MSQSKYPYEEFSGALQQKTTTHIRKPNEIEDCKNVWFHIVLGSMVRRDGAQSTVADMPKLPVNAPTLGAYIANFSSAVEIWAVQNDTAVSPTNAVLQYWTGPNPDDWTNIKTDMVKNSEVNITDDLDEIWVSSYDPVADTVGDPFTVNSAHSVSTSRHLDFAPKGRFYDEFGGSMWAANVTVNGVRYRDRIYKSSGPTGVFAFVRAATTLTQTAADPTHWSGPLAVDSVRYVKPTQVIDIYTGGTETKLYTLTVASVDKVLDTVTFADPDTLQFANTDITTGSDQIAIPTAAWAITGTPVTFWQGSGLPAGLAQGTVYYVIKVSTNVIKLASTLANANAGTAVDITTQGTGTHRITFSPVFANKDEFWKTGRKGTLSRFWNVDYRNPEKSDYNKLPATKDGLNDITALVSTINRQFIFTINSMHRYDGQNLIPLRKDVGCVAHKSIGFYDSFMVWLDANGRIWIRNDEAGTQDVISEAIVNTMKLVPQSQLPEATNVCIDGFYKLYLGQIDNLSLRVTYNFRTNQWSEEWFTPKFLIQLPYVYDGTIHPHFFDETGQMWVDEEGNDDNGEVIPMEATTGNDNLTVDETKSIKGIKIYSSNSAGTKVYVSIDGGDFDEVGEIRQPVDSIPISGLKNGTMVNLKFTNSSSGDPPKIDKATLWFTKEEDTFRATKPN